MGPLIPASARAEQRGVANAARAQCAFIVAKRRKHILTIHALLLAQTTATQQTKAFESRAMSRNDGRDQNLLPSARKARAVA
jgi:hypothetical protein